MTHSSFDLKQRMDDLRQAITAEMQRVLKLTDAKSDFYHGMMHYHMGWINESFDSEVVYAGKMIRPILTLLCCQAAGGDWQQALPAAASIEILHNFSLVHDDIEDNSPTRRGRNTVWKIWGVPQAINVGDAMFTMAQMSMVNLAERGVPAEVVVTAMRRLNETCLALTQGQCADMSFETRDDVTVKEYVDMITGKTAVLIALSCELGARIAGADEATAQHYAQFGRDLGLAFQVIDDILGVWGDEALIGKSAESDILTKKKSIPILYGLEKNPELVAHYQQPADGSEYVTQAVALLDAVQARAYSEAEASQYSESALGHLVAAQPQGEAAQALDLLAMMLLGRNS